MKPLAPNTMIQNRYLVVHAIGKGGMGEVYLAVDQRLGSAVALKRTFFNDDNALGSAFEREARILARLRHPVLPKVIDHFAENGDQFLVMEHISGDDLSKRLENAKKPFPLSWVMFWADQMLDALSYLHSHEPPIVHRDIKPQNLKLTDENHIVLLDFGLSKDFDTKSTSNPLNSASVAGYSPHFASMEQVRGTGTDPRSDLYSLSATLYQLLSDTVPVDALSRADALLGGQADPIVPLSKLNADVSDAVSSVLLKGLAIRQDERYQSASDMQKALRRAYNQGQAEPDVKMPSPANANVGAITNPQSETGRLAMEATVQMDKPDASNAANVTSTSEQKTEVLNVPLGAVTEVLPNDAEQATQARPRADHSSSTTVTDKPGQAPPPSPNMAGSAPPPPAASSPSAAHAAPAAVAAMPKKKSRTGLVIGVLLTMLVLGAAIAGGGYYAYKNYYVPAAATPTPSPSATATPSTPSASPTESVVETNTNNDSNASVAGPTAEPTRDTTNPNLPRQTSTPIVKPTLPRSSATPGTKPTPKTKPKDDRTVILQ